MPLLPASVPMAKKITANMKNNLANIAATPIMNPTINLEDRDLETLQPTIVKPMDKNMDHTAANAQLFKPPGYMTLTCATYTDTMNWTIVKT